MLFFLFQNIFTKSQLFNKKLSWCKKQLQKIIDTLNNQKLDFVLSLGDIGNGDNASEVTEMLKVYASSVNPVRFVIGNHDLVQYSHEEFALLTGMPSDFYSYDIERKT